MQNALEKAAEDITSLAGYDLKEVMGTGTGASINNRSWASRRALSTGCPSHARSLTRWNQRQPAPMAATAEHLKEHFCVSRINLYMAEPNWPAGPMRFTGNGWDNIWKSG